VKKIKIEDVVGARTASANENTVGNMAKKRKVALYLAYLGVGYQGMQRNPGAKSIEDELEKAICAAGGISESNAGDFSKVSWARAARTDKGVSAVGQVVSFKMIVEPPGIIDRINENLPETIRVFGYTRVTNGFHSKNHCDRRRYEYVLPVKAFDKRWGLPREDRLDVNADPNANAPEPADSRVPPPPTQPSDTCFEFDESVRQRLNRVLSHYVGTRNFHNFTVRVSPTDESAKRYILSFEASAPFEVMGEKFVSLVVLGQSFMLHQIRKMVGMALAVMRDVAPETVYEDAFSSTSEMVTPLAPELGLFLDEPIYNAYNTNFHETHEPVTLSRFKNEVEAFKHKHIYPHIAQTERNERTVENWLRDMNKRNYKFVPLPVTKMNKTKLSKKDAVCAMTVGQHETYGLPKGTDVSSTTQNDSQK